MKGRRVKATVAQIIPLTDSIMHLILVPEEYIDYKAGQYLNIILDGQESSYSIANAPLGSHKYELHIRHSSENPFHLRLFEHIREQGVLSLDLPYGDCSIDKLDSARPVLFIAGGTGFAPIKSMMEYLLATGDPRTFEFFWGARARGDLYMDHLVQNWYQHVTHFNYYAALADEEQSQPLVSQLMERHGHDLVNYEIVLSGPFDMVYHVRDTLLNLGVTADHLFSDAFSFEIK
ncbi:MAG: NAD(P)H-flavin reductase [Legionella sp. 40-6]|nr:NAD(P)H-flavin reductase [Legionella sp.]OJY47079.1 MAG: NAD(P)H-flavin reductase [Legionella sp. 40-6]